MADVLLDSGRRVLIGGGYGYGYGYGYGLPQKPQTPQPPPPPSTPENQLLGRLDQMDLRLRQLEEQLQQRPSPADDVTVSAPARRAPAAAAQHQHTKSLPAALQQVQVRVDLMDRLNLLESRIRQLSSELDLDVVGGGNGNGNGNGKAAAHRLGLRLGSSASSVPPVEDPAATWFDCAPVAVVDPAPFGGGGVGGGNVQGKKSKPAAAAAAAAAGGGSWSAVEFLQRGARQLHRSASTKPAPPAKVKKQKMVKAAAERKTSRRWFIVGC